MENYLTPSERMQLAERLRAQRAARLGYSPTDTSALSYYLPKTAAQPLSRQVRGATVPEGRSTETREAKDDAEWYERAGATALDAVANVGLGAFDALEGIYDIGAGLVGEIGGWFSEDFKKAVEENVEYDAIGSLEKTLDDLGLEHSYLNEEGVGEFVGGVARGVGGMLPAILTSFAITAASAGTAAPVALGLTGAQLASLGVMAGGAAGQSTEEALNDGANLEGALLYGAASGAVEAGTEMLLPGLTGELTGKGLPFLKSLAKSEVADTGAKRIFKGMAEEAFEEGLATAVNPLTKTTYKGAEALKEYTEPEFLGDVLRDAASGAAVAGAFGGTVGRIMHTSGKDADISASIEAIKDNDKEGARLVAENGALTESEEAKLRENKLKNIANIENALQSVSDEKRAKLMERHNLKNLFDESGKISPDFKAELMGWTVEAPNPENGAVEDGTGGSVLSDGVDRRYASYGLWGKQKTVDADLAAMTEEYRKITNDENARVELFRGELTDAEAEVFASARRAIHNLSDRTATGIELALVEGSSDSTRVNGAVKGNTVYISKESLSDGSWAETTVEEVSHFAEGTESYRKVIKFLAKDERFADAVLNSLTAKGNPYGFTKADVDSILKKLGTRNAYVLDRRSSAGYNVSARFALKRAKYIPNNRIGIRSLSHIRSELNKLYFGIDNGIADEIAVEEGNTVFIVDSGKENGVINFAVREKIKIDDKELRAQFIRRRNNDAVSKGKVSDGLFGKLGDGLDVNRSDDRRFESGAELSADQEQSQHHTQGVRGELRGSERGDRVRGISDKAEFSLKSTSEGEPTEPVDGEVSSGEELTWKERMLINELRAHLSAEALGSEAFMRKILESDASLAEKLLNRIKSLKNAFTGSKDPSVRAQSQRLSKAEKLWLRAVDDAGYKYAAGKIVKMLEEEKERQDEDATRMNAEKVQDGEALDNAENAEKMQDDGFVGDYTKRSYNPEQAELLSNLPIEALQNAVDSNGALSFNAIGLGGDTATQQKWIDAGLTYTEDGKVYVDENAVLDERDRRRKASKEAKTATRMNAEKVQDAENEVDNEDAAEYNGGTQFSLSDNRDTYTEKQYNDFGWAYEENALSGGKRDDFHSKFAQVVKGRVSAPKTKNGEYMIAVSDIYDSDMEGVNNTIVYAKGSIESPEITRVLDIDEYEETILDPIRRNLYDIERRGIQQKTGDLFRFHYPTDRGFERYRQRNRKGVNKDNNQLGVRRNGSGKETRRLKEVRFDEDGNEISRTYYENPQFSLSSKQESDGARAKANANRSRSKTYTRAEAAAIMNAVAEGATDAEGNPIRIKGQKGKLIDALWERLNEVDENSGKRGGMALDLADHMIRASVVEDLEYDPSEEVYLDRLDVLNGYRNKLDLSSLRGEIKHAYNDKSGRVYLTWSQKDGGMTPDQIKEELAERGIVIEADTPADILFEMDRMYTEAREYFKQKTNARLSDWMNADELNAYRQSLAQKILKETEGKGSASELARDYRRREADFKRREAFMKEEIARMRKDFKASSDFVYKVGKLRKQLTDGIKKQHSVKSINDPRFKESLGKLTGMTRAGQLLDKNTRKIFASVNEWYTKENELFRDSQTEDGKIEPNRYYNEEVKACMDALAKGKGRLTGEDIKRADLAVSYFSKLIESYNMVYRNGRYVDAVEIAKKNIANVKRTKLLKCGMMHKIYQKGLADIVDPVTLMRYADGYESGFFVETFEELRRGAMEMAFTRMELMEDYDAFFEEHKDYPKRMEEVVEFRGVKIPRNVLLSAYMTSKREHSHKGFVESGMTFKDPKTGDGVRIAPLGDPSVTYTDAEVERMIANMQKEMEAHFNDTDRAYISMVEKIFGRCADIKTETDMHRLGFTNVDKDAYYYPIARATRPINLDSDSILEAMERVNSLSMNKDTVKGANAMLYIDTVDAVFRRHVNQVSLYHGLSDAVDNFNKLVNLNTNDGPGVPISINTELDTAFGKMALNYLRTMKNDIEGMATLSESDRKWNKLITELRGKYATFQLGANPKVWATQLSSLLSASNLLDASSIARGMTMYGGHEKGVEADVDKYCRLAKLRHSENTVVEAQSVMKRSTNKLTELSMKPIGGVDRFVINRLWGACQAQVAANHKGDSSMEIGKEANKKEAGKLLERVILETQQNSLMTERSGWMRSKNELVKGLTMFSADAMKNVGRVFDGIGEIHVLKQELKSETLTENERKTLETRLKEARKRAVRASAALIANAVFMAAIALAFQSLMRQNEDKEPEEIAGEFGVDAIGNLLGGIPLLRDAYGFFANGYEIDHFLLSTMNDFLTTVQGSIEAIGKGFDGTLTSQDAAKAVRDVVYSIGQLSGLPFRNLYKYTTGLVSMVSPSTGYWIGSQFKHNPYRADLKKAIEAGDTHKVSTIAGLITEENYSNQSKETKEALRALVSEGHVVLPRTLSDTVTVNNETVTLTDEQKAKMQQVYAASDKAVDELVSMQLFRESTSEEKAKALGKIYDLYYNLAVDHALGLDTEERSILFAEALDVELLAMIAARANELKADVDKNGKTISGSRKAKVTKLVASLKLTAAEKYMVMGYLGYKNVHGANQVKAHINRLDLSKKEKERLFAYCGYGAAS